MAWLPVILVPVFFALTIVLVIVSVRQKQQRTRAVAALAQRIGFSFSAADTEHLVDMPFALFKRGQGRGVELVMAGTHDGLPLRIFDYWYYVDNGKNRDYHRFTCAAATIMAACPRLQIGHENLLTRIGDDLGLHDVQFEYDEFNRRFRVKCDDQKFAFSMIDGKMMQWLLDADDFAAVELDGPWILLARPRLQPAHWLDLGTWLEQFHRQIPPVVYSTYPPQ